MVLESESPKPFRLNFLNLFILLILIFLVLVSYFLYSRRSSEELAENDETTGQERQKQREAEYYKNALLQKAVLSFPEIENSREITLVELPSDLRSALPNSIYDPKIEKIQYVNGKDGFQINFYVSSSLEDFYYDQQKRLRAKGGWSLLSSARSNYFGFSEFEKNGVSLRIEETPSTSGTDVFIKTLK